MSETRTSEVYGFPDEYDADDDGLTGRQWRDRLVRLAPLALGLLAFELTSNPMLGMAIACLKFGWDEFRTGLWLVRSDPRPARGLACAGFHAALGFVKACVVATVAFVVAIAAISALAGRAPVDRLNHQIVGALLTISGGGAAFAMATALAILVALIGRVRVWAGPEAGRARRARTWPPAAAPERPVGPVDNAAAAVLRGAGILGVFGLFAGAVIALAVLKLLPDSPAVLPVLIVVLIGAIAVATTVVHWIASRALAATPFDCWPEPSGPGRPLAAPRGPAPMLAESPAGR